MRAARLRPVAALPRFAPRLCLALQIGLAVWLCGCGYVGDPLPPALYIPLPVEDLSAMQEGDRIVVRFTMPTRSTEDLPLGDETEVDLRAAVWENPEWNEGEWEHTAAVLPFTRDADSGEFRSPVNGFVGKRILLRVRVAGRRDRFSAWSAPVALRVLEAQQAPAGVEVKATAAGVELSWNAPEGDYGPATPRVEIWRRLENEEEFTLVGSAPGSPFVDESSRYDERHSYRVRIRAEGAEARALSPYSETASLVPVDVFPPAPPADLSAIAGTSSIELSWSRNIEADFASCRVYRAAGDGDFVPLGEPVTGSSFSDTTAPTGIALRYRVTALDTKGNESEPSAIAEVTLPE